MLGAIAGDIVGSPYEFDHRNIKTKDFLLFSHRSGFTDDSVLTVATAEVLLRHGDYAEAYRRYGLRYPHAGWGGMFRQWIRKAEMGPYGSFGNGSAMRVSPIGWAFATLEETLAEAKRSAEVTHDHPEGIKGAQAAAAAIFMARNGTDKAGIKAYVEEQFGYRLSRTLDEIRPRYHHVETCQETVPEAITAFLESESFEDAIRNAVSLGGDSDTLTCITGGIAEAYYGIPDEIAEAALSRLDADLYQVVQQFRSQCDRKLGLLF